MMFFIRVGRNDVSLSEDVLVAHRIYLEKHAPKTTLIGRAGDGGKFTETVFVYDADTLEDARLFAQNDPIALNNGREYIIVQDFIIRGMAGVYPID